MLLTLFLIGTLGTVIDASRDLNPITGTPSEDDPCISERASSRNTVAGKGYKILLKLEDPPPTRWTLRVEPGDTNQTLSLEFQHTRTERERGICFYDVMDVSEVLLGSLEMWWKEWQMLEVTDSTLAVSKPRDAEGEEVMEKHVSSSSSSSYLSTVTSTLPLHPNSSSRPLAYLQGRKTFQVMVQSKNAYIELIFSCYTGCVVWKTPVTDDAHIIPLGSSGYHDIWVWTPQHDKGTININNKHSNNINKPSETTLQLGISVNHAQQINNEKFPFIHSYTSSWTRLRATQDTDEGKVVLESFQNSEGDKNVDETQGRSTVVESRPKTIQTGDTVNIYFDSEKTALWSQGCYPGLAELMEDPPTEEVQWFFIGGIAVASLALGTTIICLWHQYKAGKLPCGARRRSNETDIPVVWRDSLVTSSVVGPSSGLLRHHDSSPSRRKGNGDGIATEDDDNPSTPQAQILSPGGIVIETPERSSSTREHCRGASQENSSTRRQLAKASGHGDSAAGERRHKRGVAECNTPVGRCKHTHPSRSTGENADRDRMPKVRPAQPKDSSVDGTTVYPKDTGNLSVPEQASSESRNSPSTHRKNRHHRSELTDSYRDDASASTGGNSCHNGLGEDHKVGDGRHGRSLDRHEHQTAAQQQEPTGSQQRTNKPGERKKKRGHGSKSSVKRHRDEKPDPAQSHFQDDQFSQEAEDANEGHSKERELRGDKEGEDGRESSLHVQHKKTAATEKTSGRSSKERQATAVHLAAQADEHAAPVKKRDRDKPRPQVAESPDGDSHYETIAPPLQAKHILPEPEPPLSKKSQETPSSKISHSEHSSLKQRRQKTSPSRRNQEDKYASEHHMGEDTRHHKPGKRHHTQEICSSTLPDRYRRERVHRIQNEAQIPHPCHSLNRIGELPPPLAMPLYSCGPDGYLSPSYPMDSSTVSSHSRLVVPGGRRSPVPLVVQSHHNIMYPAMTPIIRSGSQAMIMPPAGSPAVSKGSHRRGRSPLPSAGTHSHPGTSRHHILVPGQSPGVMSYGPVLGGVYSQPIDSYRPPSDEDDGHYDQLDYT